MQGSLTQDVERKARNRESAEIAFTCYSCLLDAESHCLALIGLQKIRERCLLTERSVTLGVTEHGPALSMPDMYKRPCGRGLTEHGPASSMPGMYARPCGRGLKARPHDRTVSGGHTLNVRHRTNLADKPANCPCLSLIEYTRQYPSLE